MRITRIDRKGREIPEEKESSGLVKAIAAFALAGLILFGSCNTIARYNLMKIIDNNTLEYKQTQVAYNR